MRKFITDILAKANLGVEQNAYVLGTVGIGTASPSYKLHVEGTIYSPTYTSGGITINSGDFLFSAEGGGDGFQMDYYNGQMYLGNNAGTSWHMVMQDNGNIGIGTTSPTDKLQVIASTYNGITITTPDVATFKMRSSSGATTSWGFATTNLSASDFGIYESNSVAGDPINAGTARLYFKTGGNIGIGTTSPVTKFHISGSSNDIGTRMTNTTAIKTFMSYVDTSGNYIVYDQTADANRFIIYSAGNSFFSGNVGIGTGSPSGKLSIVTSGTNDLLYLNSGVNTDFAYKIVSGSDDAFVLRRQHTTQGDLSIMSWTYSGNVGIGTTSPGYRLDVNVASTSDALRIQQGGNSRFILNGDGVMLWGGGSANAGYLSWDTSVAIIGGQSGNALALYAGGERMRITNAGNVGIGTTSPSQKLDVSGVTSTQGLYIPGLYAFGQASSGIEMQLTSTLYNAIRFYQGSDSTGVIHSFGRSWVGGVSVGMINIQGYNGVSIGAWDAPTATFLSSGNVGIGTTGPGEKLTVNGAIGYQYSGTQTWHTYANSANSWELVRSGIATRMLVTSDGNVGIGTTSPNIKLEVNGASGEVLRVSMTNTYVANAGPKISLWNGVSEELGFVRGVFNETGQGNRGNLLFGTRTSDALGAETKMTILHDGKVGIGTATPTQKLDVNGVIAIKGANFAENDSNYTMIYKAQSNSIGMYLGGSGDLTNYYDNNGHFFRNSGGGTTYVVINSAGMGIGTTSPSYKLDVNGSARVSGSLIGTNATFNLGATTAFEINSTTGYNSSINYGVNNTWYFTAQVLGDAPNLGDYRVYSYSAGEVFKLKYSTGAATFSSTITASNYYASNGGFFGWGDSSTRVDGDSSNQYIRAVINNTERLRIDPAGNVGIGTSSPAYKLDVNGDGRFSGRLTMSTGGYVVTNNDIVWGNISGNYIGQYYNGTDLHFYNGTGGANFFSITRSTGAATFSSSVTTGGDIQSNGIYRDYQGEALLQTTTGAITQLGSAGAGTPRTLAFLAGNAERMRIDTSGNVGIGVIPSSWSTVTPMLQIGTGGAFIGGQGSANVIRVGVNTYYDGSVWRYINSGSASWFETASGAFGWLNAAAGSAGGVASIVNLMTLSASGNLGIGTSSPSEKLHVIGKGIFESNVRIYPVSESWAEGLSFIMPTAGNWGGLRWQRQRGNNDGNWYVGFTALDSTDDLVFGANNGGSQVNNIIRLTKAGNVGIGTASPANKLEVYTSATAENVFSVNNGTQRLQLGVNNSEGSFVFEQNSYALRFGTANAEKMRITADGNVGIGTTSPGFKLTVAGDSGNWATKFSSGTASAYFALSGGYGASIDAGTSATSSTYLLELVSNGSTRMYVRGDGNVGIGTTSPGYKLHVSGNVYINETLFVNQLTTIEDSLIVYDNLGVGTTTPTAFLHIAGQFESNYALKLSGTYGTGRTFGWKTNGGNSDVISLYDVTQGSRMAFFGYTQIGFEVNGVSRLHIADGGNVGIGTNSPTQALTIQKSGYPIIDFYDGATGRGDIGYNTGTTSFNVSAYSSTPMAFYSNGLERMRITAGGNVGIGITNPGHKLHVVGAVGIGQNTNGTATIDAYGGKAYYGCDGTQITVAGNTGNVGIGTTSPGYKLEVAGTSYFSGLAHFGQTASSGSAFRWGAFGTAVSSDTMLCHNQLWNGSGWTILDSSVGTGYMNLGGQLASPNIQFGTGAANTAASTKMIILNNGNVGIGTTSPSAKLDVSGTVITTSTLGSTAGSYAIDHPGINTWKIGVTATNSSTFHIGNDTGGSFVNKILNITAGGNVGIGITSPSYKLDVSGTVRLGGTEGEAYPIKMGWDSNAVYLGGPNNNTINTAYDVNSSYNMHINYVGYLGGTTQFRNLVVNNGKQALIAHFDGATRNVGIGTTSPSYKLHVEGNVSGISIYASHDIAAFSDITVKKEVKRIENAIEKVKELNGYTYVRTDDETGTRRAGVIAQEVQKVLPEVVSANPDGTLNVAYSNMIALLIEGMKEQQATIERMQQEINELKK